MVFQRTLANEASVTVTGVAPPTATLIEARFVPLAVGQGTPTTWKRVDILTGSSVFRGQVTVSAGWYRLDVRATSGTTLLTETHVNRVGVGEVFVVAGQSNQYGGFQRIPSSIDDRVSCVDFRQDSLSEQLLPLQFSHINYGTSIGPSQPPHIWSVLGDKLAQRLNVPILFLGASLGGTSSAEWQQSAAGILGPTVNASVYRRMGAVLLHYVRRTGARAVLWHQGESDQLVNTSTQTYFDNIRFVIEKSRQQLNAAPLPWVVARASYINYQASPSVIAAQNKLISDVPAVFAGPATDSIIGPENRPDGVHFRNAGFTRFANSWDQSLTTTFFATAVPITPSDESTLITSGYTLPLTRRPGETLVAASLRSDAHEADNVYKAQVVRVDNGTVAYESPGGTDNPLLVTLPANLPDGFYRLRTISTRPTTTGAFGEPFRVQQSAPAASVPKAILQLPVIGGTADASLFQVGYRYELGSHGFYIMIRADALIEGRMERIDGGSFGDSNWNPALPSAQAPDYDDFADFNYLRNYPPASFAVGGVEPGRYRLSVRRQGTTGPGIWFETDLRDGRVVLYQSMDPTGPIPPVVALTNPNTSTCLTTSFPVAIEVTDGSIGAGNTFSVRLSNATGSFANETIIGTGSTSPIQVTVPPNLPAGNKYRIRVVASSPAVASAPSDPLFLCNAQADLSLSMQISNRTPSINQPVTVTLVLTNAGPNATSGVTAGSLLPDGVVFLNSSSPYLTGSASSLTMDVGTLSTGESRVAAFQLKATRPGTFATAAQIVNSSATDPDSQPNSGTGDGQDDATLIDLRTADGTGPLTVSPNPNQTPLPSVQTNQPPTSTTTADLSVLLSADHLTLQPNDVVRLMLTISNRGGATAGNVAVQALLPTGWQLTDTSGLQINGQAVTGTIAAIESGRSVTFPLSVRVNGAGTVQAQVLSAAPNDPDSTPGNGFGNGEDDEAVLSLRVR